MSQMQRCDQGHFYDASRHRRCPACGIPGLDVGFTVPATAPYEATAPQPTMPVRPPQAAGRGSADDGATQRISPALQPDAPTVAFWHKPNRTAPQPGAPEPAGDAPIDPVVGWLVAIDGPVKGRDFRVFSEGNDIGRANSCRIVIKDESISQSSPHALLTFDPRSEDAAYYIQPAGRHMLYIFRKGGEGREPVLTPVRLQPYDVLEMGRTRLLFVPLCNEYFRWQLADEDEEV
jgi:hypothetical protein